MNSIPKPKVANVVGSGTLEAALAIILPEKVFWMNPWVVSCCSSANIDGVIWAKFADIRALNGVDPLAEVPVNATPVNDIDTVTPVGLDRSKTPGSPIAVQPARALSAAVSVHVGYGGGPIIWFPMLVTLRVIPFLSVSQGATETPPELKGSALIVAV